MNRKLIISFSISSLVSLLGIIVCAIVMLLPKSTSGNNTDFWNNSEGIYETYYTLYGEDSMSSSMISTYLEPIIYIEFEDDFVKFIITMNIEQEKNTMLYIDDNGFKECLYDEEDLNKTSFSYTTNKESFTSDVISLKMKIAAMPFEPQFSLILSLDTAYLISNM
ncbi:MAG: hypothetical protein R3Y05_02775 [bacterium]